MGQGRGVDSYAVVVARLHARAKTSRRRRAGGVEVGLGHRDATQAAAGASRARSRRSAVNTSSFAPRCAHVRLEVLPVLERVVRSYTTPVRARGVAAATVLGARAGVALMIHVVLEVLELVERALRLAAALPRAVLSAAAL